MTKITPFLWFDHHAEEAARFYVSLFKNSRIVSASPMVVNFELNGQSFAALNGGPRFRFTEAVSFVVNCETQQEIDDYWSKLTADGGQPSMCGWLKDKYGLSWQVVPSNIGQLLQQPDREKQQRVTDALMKMRKIDVDTLVAAAR
jgi:predicted 3-demethylubiquinone-9 3-methyltransferase (glyoxalase superfamily)